ncbi:MAG TPA: PQQ-binding-like beta-propeller repeat protein [Gaiellaceae bacterium]|nr:PQQ-binding-like beta-propeller repeat protein [Gaiellaceae bacterium]
MKRLVSIASAALLVVIVVLAVGCGGDGGGGSDSSVAPAFSSTELSSLPTTNWITNGGSVANQRYSPLDQINARNVSRLKGVWHVHLRSGIAGKYSGEAQPIVYKNVIYIITGADDVFAIDAHTGKTKWSYRANLNQKIDTICCGWTNRGVAIGDGRVYFGQLDGKVVALNQQTGRVVWTNQLANFRQGTTITSAPLYYGGRIYIGMSGGEYGIRGRLTALDAKNGDLVWRFYTIPGPGEVGHKTWPADNDSWKHGGAPVWQTPAVDPNLGLIYFSTGNASPDFNAAIRPGDNLFSSSILALDVKTGKYRWHYQEVHHDIWDYDATSPVVLFKVSVGGRERSAIAQAGKTGWVYILDRENGKPLIGIDERPVPQAPAQHTAPTQPYPRGDATIVQSVQPDAFRTFAKTLPKGTKLTNGGRIFTPYAPGGTSVSTPSSLGGTNWFPMSFNQKTGFLYVCGIQQAQLFEGGKTAVYKSGKQFYGSAIAPQGTPSGTFTAINAATNRIAWQKQFRDSCYSGSTTTGGNLAFVGRNDGRLQAYNATNGKLLWNFQTGSGANNTASVFSLDGKQVVAFYAAGSALAGSPHGDDVWLFGLEGKLGPAQAGSSSGAKKHAGEKKAPKTNAPAKASSVNVGATEFKFTLSTQTVRTGKVTFKVVNNGGIPHNMRINGQQTPNIDPGSSATLAVTFTKPGKYPYLCTIPGHAAAGMKGVLTVG